MNNNLKCVNLPVITLTEFCVKHDYSVWSRLTLVNGYYICHTLYLPGSYLVQRFSLMYIQLCANLIGLHMLPVVAPFMF